VVRYATDLNINDDPLHVDAHEAGGNLKHAVRLEWDEDEHDILQLGRGQTLDGEQYTLNTQKKINNRLLFFLQL